MPIPEAPASSCQGEFAPLINPVFADTFSASSLSYRWMKYDTQDDANHLFLMNLAGFSFSYTWFDHIYSTRDQDINSTKSKLFTLGKGFWFNNSFGFGANYSVSKSKYDSYNNYKAWSAGFLLQPASFLSLACVLKDINSPKLNSDVIKREEIYSISVRPFSHYLTLSADARRTAGEKLKDSTFFYSAHLMAPRDISISATIDNSKNFSFGMTLPVDFSRTRGSTFILDYYRNNNTEQPDTSQFGVTISNERHVEPLTTINRLLKISINTEIPEIGTESLFGEKTPIFYDLLNAIHTAREDDCIAGIILSIERNPFGFAQIQEIRSELMKFRKTGKKVYAILSTSGNRDYYLASMSDKLYFIPSSTFSLSALKAEVYLFKKTLDKIGIEMESIRKGKYKSFNEPFTREHISKEFRDNLTSILTNLNDQYLGDIKKDRKLPASQLDSLLNTRGVLTPVEAKKAGFIDSINYPDYALKEILDQYGFNSVTISLQEYIRENKKTYTWGKSPAIAVVYVSGSIIRGRAPESRFSVSAIIGDKDYKQLLRNVFYNRSVKAVVIRINSGGGSALASDLMWHYLKNLKEKYNKPVVFSFGNIAASGGYYIACTGDKIFISAGTITGSIGVISGKLTLTRLYEKIGINKDTIKLSKFADILSESKALTPEERTVLINSVSFIYKQFTDKVSNARNINPSNIPETAEGKVFTGSQALKNRLADNPGGLLAAIQYARKISDINSTYRILHLPRKKVPLIDDIDFDPGSLAGFKTVLKPFIEKVIPMRYCDEPYLYLFPYYIKIE